MPAERFDPLLPEMELLIGQSDMPKARLDRAPKLRASSMSRPISCRTSTTRPALQRGVHVLAPGSAFAQPVAEMTLGLAIDLCRGVTAADRAMRAGREKWLLDGAEGCFSLYGARVGLIGFGDLARAFIPLLHPFGCRSTPMIRGSPTISWRASGSIRLRSTSSSARAGSSSFSPP